MSGHNIQESFIDLVESTYILTAEIFDENLTLHTEMPSQSWENNPDLSLLPHEGPQSKQQIKLSDVESGSCPKCC